MIKQSPGPSHNDLEQARARCPLPTLMEHLGLKRCVQKSCKSPFRDDKDASFSVYAKDGRSFWKDFGTGDGGDEIAFLARVLGIEEEGNFITLLNAFKAIADNCKFGTKVAVVQEKDIFPDRNGFVPGTEAQIKALSVLRGISVPALKWAQKRGVLVFGRYKDREVFGVTDQSSRVLEVRRLDGKEFFEGEQYQRKAQAIQGSDKSWPVGIVESAPYPCIALVEGLPDFLAAHDFALKEAKGNSKSNVQCVPVALLGAAVRIHEEALQRFQGKKIRIFPHADEKGTGVLAAARWIDQLNRAGIYNVSIFDTTALRKLTGGKVKDVNDWLKLNDEALKTKYPQLKKLLPDK